MGETHSRYWRNSIQFCVSVMCFALLSFSTSAQQVSDRAGGDRGVANGGQVQGAVWLDTNANGIRDKGESGVLGAQVSLLRCDGSFVAAQTTNRKGMASFNRVPEGCYRLRYNSMEGYRFCPTDLTEDEFLDSDADPTTGLTDSFEMRTDFLPKYLDAGVITVSATEIGDRVWEDTNANGFQDINEPGLGGVKVDLYTCSEGPAQSQNGVAVSATSNDDGSFLFGSIATGCYKLFFNLPHDYNFSISDTPFGGYDSDADYQSGMTREVNVGQGQAQFNLDAGMYRKASIGDWVWVDANNNGVQDADEQGIADVQVVLLHANGVPTGMSAVTDAQGYYQVNDVTPGSYRLQFAAPQGYSFVHPLQGGDNNLDSDANGLGTTAAFEVASGADHMSKDAAVVVASETRITLEKLTNGVDADDPTGPFVLVGGDVLWEYVVTNTTFSQLFDITVVDNAGVSVTCPQDVLEVGETMTCTGSTDDAQAGQYQNEGIACGYRIDSGPWCDKDLSHYFGADPSISIQKSTNGEDADVAPGPFITPGDTVTWEYVVQNTGNVTLDNVIVTDNQGVVVTCPSMSLDPGVSMSCTGTGIAIEGQYANLGTVVGEPPVGPPVDDEDPSHYFGPSASIDIEKATNGEDADDPTGPIVFAGDTVEWTYVVTNTGTIDLVDIVVTDNQGVALTCEADTLAPGDSFTCFGDGIATPGQYANIGSVVGQGVNGDGDPVGEPVVDSDPSHYFAVDPSIDIEKATNGEDADTPTGPTLTEGDDVTWTYVVTNTGNTPLVDIVVTDDQGVSVSCPATTLAVGASFTCTATGTATVGQYANLGVVTAEGVDPNGDPLPPGGDPITDDDPSHYIGEPQPTAAIGDFVFKDLDGNGQQDDGEPGVPGITVNLWTDDDGDGTPDTQIATTTTDSDGMYGFTDLDPDLTYVIQFINDPAMNMPFTLPNTGPDGSDSDAGPGGITGPINLEPGETDNTIDAGLVNLPASLGDRVWKDLNSNGQQDDGEPGVPGITVNLWTDDDGDGTPDTQINTTTTDADGIYGFTDLDPTLTYVVQFVNDPAMNMPFTVANTGPDGTDSDAGDGGITGPITLTSGENNPTIDAGLVNLPASLGDRVWKDLNSDGQQDDGEPGIPGITVNLWTDDDGDGTPDTQINTTTTDADGIYGFIDLDPALTYVVQFINDPAMNMPFTVANTGPDGSDSDAGPGGITGPINLSSGENNPTIDAGLVNQSASLGDRVWKDLNSNGQQDDGEPGVPGITVNLWTDDDGDGTPDTQINTTTTDADGIYGFTDLDPTLVYVVQFINDPAMNMPFTVANTGPDATDSDAGTGGITGPITLTSGENNPTIDAGLVNLPASLGDRVWKDLNSDGQQDDGEPGIPGITVNLWTDDDGDGTPDTQIATTTTDADGIYGFTDLDPTLTYVVQFVNDPAMNMPFTVANTGPDGSDSDAGPGGITGPINLSSGENNPTIDAGLVNLPASLGDRVWKDLNGNGQQDDDEPGVPGITVNLWTDDDGDGTPDTQIATTTTDADGIYGFADLDPTLVYVVQFVNDPAMNMPFTVANTGNDASDSDAGPDGITGPITLTSGENNPTIDAGLVNQPASLGDRVWKDLNSNGQQDDGEPGVPGITVNLWTDDDGDGTPDTQINTTTTDADGIYGFTDLDTTLVYVVQFVNDPAMNMPFTVANTGPDGTDSDAGDGGITGPITLTSGENNPTIDAGLVNLPASLGDRVWKDLNSDGQQDDGEPGVPGITVNLWTDDNGDGTPDTQIATTTTDADGFYGFTDLDPTLVYVVQFVNDPAMNMPFTVANTGPDGSDSDAGPDGITGPINLSSGENNPTIDAGLVNLVAKLGDFVWLDQNRDGIQDAGEPGIEGAIVNLWIDNDGDGTPDVQVATTSTDGDGMYMFNDLIPGVNYIVEFEGIPGKPFTTQGQGGDIGLDSNADPATGITAPVVLSSGEFNPTIDAGVIMLMPSIQLEKATNGEDADTPTGPVVEVGSTVNWTYVVTNTGELTLANIAVSDDQGVAVTCPATTLNPGESFTCTGSGIATEGQYANLGSVVGQPLFNNEPIGDPVSDDDPSHYFAEVTACVPGYLADHFNNVSYSNSDGDMAWTGPWMENDPQGGGASSGSVMIENGQLVIRDYPDSGTKPGIKREADLSGYPAAMLMFDWSTSDEVDTNDSAQVRISSDGGNTWTVLRTYTNLSGWNGGSEVFDISDYISDEVVIQFRIQDYYGAVWDKFMIDNVRIDKKCDEACVPGYVKDHFSHVSYSNNDGDMDWDSDWIEHDPNGGGAHSGMVMIDDGKLVLRDYPNSGTHPSASREVNLSGYNSAMLQYEWSTSDEVDANDSAVVEISTDGGNTFHLLKRYSGLSGWNGGTEMLDISAYISDETVLRFRIEEYYGAQWDKFMINFVRIDKKCDNAPTGQVCEVDETPYHALYLPNFNGDGVLDLYNLEPGAQFVQNADGTATMSGVVFKQGEPDYRFQMDIQMSGGTATPPPGSPYNPQSADPADWFYYPVWSGTLTGLSWQTGAYLTFERTGASFQVGTGANAHPGENDVYGGSGWFNFWTHSQPQDCDYYGDCIVHEGNGDVNVRLNNCVAQ